VRWAVAGGAEQFRGPRCTAFLARLALLLLLAAPLITAQSGETCRRHTAQLQRAAVQ